MDAPKHYHFVTGRLAETALRRIVEEVSRELKFQYTVQVMPITVAALMTADWIERRLEIPSQADCVMLPGYTNGSLDSLCRLSPVDVVRGPKDLRDLPSSLGASHYHPPYGEYTIEIVAEINHAPQQTIAETVAQAKVLSEAGADIIDVGCDPGDEWSDVGECVKELRAAGLRVSIDSLQIPEIERAVAAGAELVLSINGDNRHAAVDWDAELIAIPQTPQDTPSLDETIEFLDQHNCRFRMDPILEPIGCGFTPSIVRYAEARDRYPDLPMLMGIGNITELTECDSAGVNMMLMGICQELNITQVLTTQVIPWAQSSVQECHIARQLAHYAIQFATPPKHVDSRLVTLRDAKVESYGDEFLLDLAGRLKDPNYRLFAEHGLIHIMAAGIHESADDPFDLFEQLCKSGAGGQMPANLDPSHAFYLGFEMAKATIALTLGKQYSQDQALDWGYLTREEISHREKRSNS
jgi:dihydropteroate synthase